MDDVDRLFECFKCGITPPESAKRERKRFKSKSRLESSTTMSKIYQSPDMELARQSCEIVKDELERTIKAKKLGKGVQLSPIMFYGSPSGVPPKRPSSLLRLLHEIRVDLAEQHKLNLRKEIWATFPRQDEAMKFAKNHEQVHIFSYQDHFNGQRRFLVSTYMEFWQRYKCMDPKLRHHYEVIQEGLPCHLYFDLEFNKGENYEKNGDEMVDLLISVVLEVFVDKYSIQGKKEWIVELDSSTEEKFSRHLIFRIPMIAFKDNSHVGAFVSEVCSRISSASVNDATYEKLFVRKDASTSGSTSQIFVDTAVYSRNRCFRLALSSKAGKSSILLPTGRFKCQGMNLKQSDEDMFMASLICNIDSGCEKLLVCKMDLDCVKTLHFDTEINSTVGVHRRALREFALSSSANYNSTAYLMRKSPFPAVDRFVEHLASSGTVTGKIRSWYWFSEHGLMVYSMSRNRFCERIGREHKSNHVIYVVDLIRAAYYQKCHDPDCRGYRSPLRQVPMDVVPNYSAFFDLDPRVHPVDTTSNMPCKDEGVTNSSPINSWWLEADRVANDIENKHWPSNLNSKDLDDQVDEDDDWWISVESTICQVEQTCLH